MSLGWSNLEECFSSPLTYKGKGGSPATNWTDVDKTRVGAASMTQTQYVQQQNPTTFQHGVPSNNHQEHSLPSSNTLPSFSSEETYRRDIGLGGDVMKPTPVPMPPEEIQPIQLEQPQITMRQPPIPIQFNQRPSPTPNPVLHYTRLQQHVTDIKNRLVKVEDQVNDQRVDAKHENHWMVILLVFIATFLLMACRKK